MTKKRLFVGIALVALLLALVGLHACKRETATPLSVLAERRGWLRLCHPDRVHSLAFSPDGRTLATGTSATSSTGGINLWDLTRPTQPITLREHTAYVSALAFAADGNTLAAGSFRGITRWDLLAARGLSVGYEEFSQPFRFAIALSPTLRHAATSHIADGPTVRLHEWASGRVVPLRPEPTNVYFLAFSPDGQFLAAAGFGQGVHVYRADTGVHCRSVRPNTGACLSLALAPGGRHLAVCHQPSRLQIWDIDGARVQHECTGHRSWIDAFAFSPDGRLLASGDRTGQVKLWDVATGAEVTGHHEHSDAVNAVAFSPDGRWLASGSSDQTVMLWRWQQSAREERP